MDAFPEGYLRFMGILDLQVVVFFLPFLDVDFPAGGGG